MIPFDINKVKVEHVLLKSCTTALGGSISIVDEARSNDDREVYTKVKAPLAIIRAFIKLHDTRFYLKPVPTAVTKYDGHIVAIERHHLGEAGEEVFDGLFGERVWVSNSEDKVETVLKPVTSEGQWFTDGTFVYMFDDQSVIDVTPLSSDGRFRAIHAESLKLSEMPELAPRTQRRTCLQYVTTTGESAMTSPIWKSLDSVGNRQLEAAEETVEDAVAFTVNTFQFDRIDQFLSVNLGFTLKAAADVAKIFGYDAIEPLQLDSLMIRLNTVNLPKVPKVVKQTFDVGLPFTHTIAWLLGMAKRTNTLESYMVIRSLLKYLTTKGIYRKGAFEPEAVFKSGKSLTDIPMMSLEEASGVNGNHEALLELVRRGQRVDTRRAVGVNAIGGLYDAD